LQYTNQKSLYLLRLKPNKTLCVVAAALALAAAAALALAATCLKEIVKRKRHTSDAT